MPKNTQKGRLKMMDPSWYIVSKVCLRFAHIFLNNKYIMYLTYLSCCVGKI